MRTISALIVAFVVAGCDAETSNVLGDIVSAGASGYTAGRQPAQMYYAPVSSVSCTRNSNIMNCQRY